MLKRNTPVKCKNGREGKVSALLDFREGKYHAVAVVHNDSEVYPNEEVVYKLESVMAI